MSIQLECYDLKKNKQKHRNSGFVVVAIVVFVGFLTTWNTEILGLQ